MKRIFLIIPLLALFIMPIKAQDYKDIIKERKEMSKLAEKELKAKVDKKAKKEAKKLQKEGWKVAPGALPLEKQLDRSYKMQLQEDENFFPLFIMGEATSIGGNYDAAKMQAVNLAKVQLAGNIQTEITGLVESSVGNEQLSQEEAESITTTTMGSVSKIAQNIGRVITVVEVYRDTKSGKEVRVVIFYNAEMAKKATMSAVQEDLKQRSDSLVSKVNNLLGL